MNILPIRNNEHMEVAPKYCWNNKDNSVFYSTVTTREFFHYAVKADMNKCHDLRHLQKYISQSMSILEIGAGYGRVIDYLLKHNYAGDITALERSKKYIYLLRSVFGDKINLLDKDILTFSSNLKYDLILWLWNGIADFHKHEQLSALKKVSSPLKKNGYCIVDTEVLDEQAERDHNNNKQFKDIITHNGVVLHGYYPHSIEIKNYCSQLDLTYVTSLSYKSDDTSKLLHVLRRDF